MKNLGIINWLRRASFWSLDLIKGKKVIKHYKRIKSFEKIDYDDLQLKNYKDKKINDLLSHTIKTVPFYANFDLKYENFPILEKRTLKDQYDKFKSGAFLDSKVFRMSTSGSTGEPFTVIQDGNKKRSVNAEIIYYSEKANYKLGNNLIYYRALTELNRKSKVALFVQNEDLIDTTQLDDKAVESFLNDIKKRRHKNAMILTYASSLVTIAEYLITNNIDKVKSNIKGIISSSEYLDDKHRKIIEEKFDVRVFSRYSNQENGVIGQDLYDNNVFIINDANYLVEIYDIEQDVLLPFGEIGRIIVTDLLNYAMPMIKYDTGDIGSIDEVIIDGVKKIAIKNFQGRKVDFVFDTKGERVSPHGITNLMWKYTSVEKYQFIQKDKNDYVLKVVSKSIIDENAIINDFKFLLGNSANVDILNVDEIKSEKSGKYRYIINEMVTNKS